MTEPLDRPIWHALAGRQSAFAEGGQRALRFAPDIEPFAAACDDAPESLAELARLLPPEGSLVLAQAGESPIPPGVVVTFTAAVVQMVARRIDPLPPTAPAQRLTEADAPEMLALATLTKPGPFLARTHRLGDFWGIKEQGRLIAMAGERMKLEGFTEVSGVCTHPSAQGRGYASLLSRIVATQILERGERPFLHAYATNAAAIRLYEKLGFALRATNKLTALARAPSFATTST